MTLFKTVAELLDVAEGPYTVWILDYIGNPLPTHPIRLQEALPLVSYRQETLEGHQQER